MKEKIKKIKISKSQIILVIIFSVITVVLSLGTSYAASTYLYDSKDVSYDNTKSGIIATDVQGAVDELYDAATDYSSMNTRVNGVEETIGDSTLTTTSQTITGGINELNNKTIKLIWKKSNAPAEWDSGGSVNYDLSNYNGIIFVYRFVDLANRYETAIIPIGYSWNIGSSDITRAVTVSTTGVSWTASSHKDYPYANIIPTIIYAF